MGRTYLFECAKCGYRARVAGGSERGLQLAVQTIQCLDCRELYDAVVELKVPDTAAISTSRWKLRAAREIEAPPTFVAALNRLAVGTGKSFRWAHYKPLCPVTTLHRVRLWRQPGKCPRCGVFLDGSGTPFKVWD